MARFPRSKPSYSKSFKSSAHPRSRLWKARAQASRSRSGPPPSALSPASSAPGGTRRDSWRGSSAAKRPPVAPREFTPPVITPRLLLEARPLYPSTALFGKKSARCGLDPDAPVITTVAMGVDVSGVGGTRVCKDFLVSSSWVKHFGWVVSFRRPLFRILYDDGDAEEVSGHELEQLVLPRESRTPLSAPQLFDYDLSCFNWFSVSEFNVMIDELLQQAGVRTPPCWTSEEERQLGVLIPEAPSPATASAAEFVAAERAHTDALLRDASNGMLAKATQMGHRLPFLKLFCYASARHLPWPLPSEDLGRYAALLGSRRGNASAPAAAVAAANMVSRLNHWNLDYNRTIAVAPQQQQARMHKSATNKVAAIEAEHVMAILSVYVFSNVSAATVPWALTIACSIGLGFKLLLRYDDLTKCRWDPGFCEVFLTSPAGPYIRFFLSGRKNDQYRGSFLDVAAPLNGLRGLFHALLRGKNHFKKGFVLRTVYNDGTPADPEKFLGHGRFVAFLRAALLSVGFASKDVGLFAAHSLRAGGATAAAVGKLSQHEIAMVSATSSTCWLEWYDRRSLVRRLQLSRSIGC